jgi:hypothetical protein
MRVRCPVYPTFLKLVSTILLETGPGAHPASCTMGTGSFPGVKRPGRGANHPPHLAPRLKKEQMYTCTPPLGLHELYLYLYLYCTSVFLKVQVCTK